MDANIHAYEFARSEERADREGAVHIQNEIILGEMKMKKTNRKQGFTLLELLIVVAILGALVGLMLPQFTASRTDARDAVAKHNANALYRTLEQYKSLNGVWPTFMHSGLRSADFTADPIVYSSVDGLSLTFGQALATALGGTFAESTSGMGGGLGYGSIAAITASVPNHPLAMGPNPAGHGYQDIMRKTGLKFFLAGNKGALTYHKKDAPDGNPVWSALVSGDAITTGDRLLMLTSAQLETLTINGSQITVNGKRLSDYADTTSRILFAYLTPQMFDSMYMKSSTGPELGWEGGSQVRLGDVPIDPNGPSVFPYYIGVFHVYGATPPGQTYLLTVLTANGENLVNP